MPKLSIYLEFVEGYARRVILKYVLEFKYNDILYIKEDFVKNNDIISYYRILLKQTKDITYIKYFERYTSSFNHYELHLKDMKLHNTSGFAFIEDNKYFKYYLNGKQLSYEHWKNSKCIRKEKLKKLLL